MSDLSLSACVKACLTHRRQRIPWGWTVNVRADEKSAIERRDAQVWITAVQGFGLDLVRRTACVELPDMRVLKYDRYATVNAVLTALDAAIEEIFPTPWWAKASPSAQPFRISTRPHARRLQPARSQP